MASTMLKSFLESLTPTPFVNPIEYDNLEYRWKFFAFRPALLAQELQWEGLIILGVFFYLGMTFYGKSYNTNIANKWFQAHIPLLTTQFSRPTSDGLTRDGYSDFFNFSTGRRNISSLHSVFSLRPRHDLCQWAFQVLWTLVDLQYRPVDSLELDIKLGDDHPLSDFVWAAVKKDELSTVKADRWDLTFTSTKDNPLLPSSLSVMSEFADITEQLLKPYGSFSLTQILSDPDNLHYFRSLSITDQPRERPTKGPLSPKDRGKHLILSLIAPPPSHASATIPLIASIFHLVDIFDKVQLRPETKAKIKKTREELDKELKTELVKEKSEEAEEDKKVAKRRAEEERISKLSASEQKKMRERERKRATRKQQGKMVRK